MRDTVRLRGLRTLDTEWLLVEARVCGVHEVDPLEVHRKNGSLALARLVLVDDAYWLRIAVPRDSAAAQPERLLQHVRDAARSLRPATTRIDADMRCLFGHFSE